MSQFYIASVKHTIKLHEHITFWARFGKGYRLTFDDHMGRYCFGEASDLNDGFDCIAIPVAIVDAILSPEPYYKPGARFIDTRGPVVDNTKAMWELPISGSISHGRQAAKVKPEVFRGHRRSFAWSPAPAAPELAKAVST